MRSTATSIRGTPLRCRPFLFALSVASCIAQPAPPSPAIVITVPVIAWPCAEVPPTFDAGPRWFTIEPATWSPESAEDAAARWDEITNASHRLRWVEGGLWRTVALDPGTGWNGGIDWGNHLVLVRPEPIGASVYAVLLHEYGHVLGLSHTPRGVMDPTRVTTEWSDEDRAEGRRVGACDP